MGFADEVATQERGRGGQRSKLILALRAMPPEMRREVIGVVDDPTFTPPAIARALKAKGYDVSADSIRHVRYGEVDIPDELR